MRGKVSLAQRFRTGEWPWMEAQHCDRKRMTSPSNVTSHIYSDLWGTSLPCRVPVLCAAPQHLPASRGTDESAPAAHAHYVARSEMPRDDPHGKGWDHFMAGGNFRKISLCRRGGSKTLPPPLVAGTASRSMGPCKTPKPRVMRIAAVLPSKA